VEDIEGISPIGDVPAFPELRNAWNELLKTEESLPQYFGLLAIQCLAGTLMEADDDGTHRDYNVRLSQLLGISDKYCLQPLYIGDNLANPIQEQIWLSATEFLRLGFGLTVHIPAPTLNAGRFIQFPKSQALLTKEDMKRCSGFFYAHFLRGETVHYSFFKQKFLSNLSEIQLSPRARGILHDSDRGENAIRQLFNHFNRWDGKVWQTPSKPSLVKKQSAPKVVEAFEGLMLVFESNNPAFFLLANSRNVHEKVISWNRNACFAFPDSFREISFFQASSLYKEEFHASRFFVPGETRYVLVDGTSKGREYRFLLENSRNEWQLGDQVYLFEPTPVEDNIPILRPYVESPASARLWGGINSGKDNSYVAHFGPEIITAGDYLVICDGRQVGSYNSDLSPGSYVVRSSENRDLKFDVVDLPISGVISPSGSGWDLRDLTPGSVAPHIEGCIAYVE